MRAPVVRTLLFACIFLILLLVSAGIMLVTEVAPMTEILNGTIKTAGIVALITLGALAIERIGGR